MNEPITKPTPVKASELRVGQVYLTSKSRVGTNLECLCPAYIFIGRLESRFLWLFVGPEFQIWSENLPHEQLTSKLDVNGLVCSRGIEPYLHSRYLVVTQQNKKCFAPTQNDVARRFVLHPDIVERLRSGRYFPKSPYKEG